MSPDIKHKKIIDIVEDKLTCSAHNLDHVFRVYNLCLLISKYEKDVDLEVLIPAALLHDIARVEESTDKTGRIDHSVLGSGIARTFMLAGQFGQRLTVNESLKDYLNSNTVENGRVKDVSKHTPFIEYEVKFKKVPGKLYTKKAREIGKERLEFMEQYFNRLKLEIEGIE